MSDQQKKTRTSHGGCLCGAVRYEIRGPLRDVVNCHCSKCRRFHGSVGAYSAVAREDLVIIDGRGLKYYDSAQDETPGVQRGFCSECGSSLFWDAPEHGHVAVAAGSLDDASDLKLMAHIWVGQKADWIEINDQLPKHVRSYDSERMD